MTSDSKFLIFKCVESKGGKEDEEEYTEVQNQEQEQEVGKTEEKADHKLTINQCHAI